MAYDFPPSPFTGQVYAGWTYDGEKWLSTTATPNTAGVIAIQVFTASGLYVPSPSMTTCVIECVGGGGAGGSTVATGVSQTCTTSGGAGGGYARKLVTAVTIGASQTVTIGAGGTAVVGPVGNTGGTTSVGALCAASGGAGGGSFNAATVASYTGSSLGGTGTIGDMLLTGQPGSGSFSVTAPNPNGQGGIGGAAAGGFGSGGQGTLNAFSFAGRNYGGGGGGIYSGASQSAYGGGAGAPGLVIVTEYGMTALASTAGQGNVRYDLPQGLSLNQKAQARANIDSLKKNYVINGAMMVSQENGATAGTVSGYFAVDQFSGFIAGTTGAYSAVQVASSTPAGSPNRFRVTVTTADAAVAATDIVWIDTRLEGLRITDLLYGTASAKTTTLQFGCKGPAGTYSVVFMNNAANRAYAAEYVIAAGEANVDVMKSVTIPGDTTGTWLKDNGVGIEIRFALMAGSTYQQAAGSWTGGNVVGSSNQFNFMGTSTPPNNVFELFDVGLYEGSVAPAFRVPDYASELALCQRYWQYCPAGGPIYFSSTTTANTGVSLPVEMRAIPTVAVPTTSIANAFITNVGFVNITSLATNNMNTADGMVTYNCSNTTATGVGFLYPPTASRKITLSARL